MKISAVAASSADGSAYVEQEGAFVSFSVELGPDEQMTVLLTPVQARIIGQEAIDLAAAAEQHTG